MATERKRQTKRMQGSNKKKEKDEAGEGKEDGTRRLGPTG
jgi:hypothetical protein